MVLKTLFTEESYGRRAVSPVIAVILMVAITVILAAVIATFVLGVGEQVSDDTPTNSWEADSSNVTVPVEIDGTGIPAEFVENTSGTLITFQMTAGDSFDPDDGTFEPPIPIEEIEANIADKDPAIGLGEDDDQYEFTIESPDGNEVTAGDSYSLAVEFFDIDNEGAQKEIVKNPILIAEEGDRATLTWSSEGTSVILQDIEFEDDIYVNFEEVDE